MARATPVLPLVASSTMRRRPSQPSSSASSTIQSAGRSLTLPPGFALSIFTQRSPRSPLPTRCRGMRGVSPIRSRIVPRTRSRTRSAVRRDTRAGLLDPDGLQRASRETKRFVGIAGRLGGARPAIEDDAEKMRRTLLSELPGLLERSPRGRAVGLHAKLAGEDEHSDLRVDLLDLSRELESGLRSLESLRGIPLGVDLRLGRFDRRESAVA